MNRVLVRFHMSFVFSKNRYLNRLSLHLQRCTSIILCFISKFKYIIIFTFRNAVPSRGESFPVHYARAQSHASSPTLLKIRQHVPADIQFRASFHHAVKRYPS